MLARIARMAIVGGILFAAAPAYSQTYKSFTVKTPDGVNISAQEWGNPAGKEIVFIHGFMQSHLSWSKQLKDPALAKQFRMISYDFRGRGGSDKIMDPALYNSWEKFAEELNAVIQAANLKKPVLVGWSYGSRIASDYLKKYGDAKIGGLNFVGGAGNSDKKHFGSAMPLIPKTFTEDLAQNIEATKAFIHGCFEKQPTAAEFEEMLAFNMVVPPKIRGLRRSAQGGQGADPGDPRRRGPDSRYRSWEIPGCDGAGRQGVVLRRRRPFPVLGRRAAFQSRTHRVHERHKINRRRQGKPPRPVGPGRLFRFRRRDRSGDSRNRFRRRR